MFTTTAPGLRRYACAVRSTLNVPSRSISTTALKPFAKVSLIDAGHFDALAMIQSNYEDPGNMELIARRGWVVLTGGRDVGVMDAACEGAKRVGGSLTIGVLPTAKDKVSRHVDVPIITEMGSGRNNINVLTSQRTTPLAHGNAQHTILVEVQKVGGGSGD